MATFSNEVIQFAAGNTDYFEAARDYVLHENARTSENNKTLNDAFFAEVEKRSGVAREGLVTEAWVSHPSVKWASFAIVDATVNAILPYVVSPAFAEFTSMKFVSYGDVVKFKVMPNQFYTVSLGGHGERTTFRQKHFAADVVVAPKEHIVTVYVDMYRVLAGKEDIGEFIRLVVLSIEREMYKEALDALTTGLAGIPNGAYSYTGAFDASRLVKMAQTVQVYNGNVKPVIAGSAVALMNVLPDSALGYRGNFDANGGSINLIKNFYGYDVLMLDQAASTAGGLILPDNELYVISPAQDKLIKGAVSNALTNTNQFYDNADLTQNFTMRKDFDFVFASAAKAGIYTISED